MEERIKNERLEELLGSDLSDKDINSELVLDLVRDLKEERDRRVELENSLKELEQMLQLLKTLGASKMKLNIIKDELGSKEMKLGSEESYHYSPHEKILACSLWLLMRARDKKNNISSPPNLSVLRENLLELKNEGQWPGTYIPSASILKIWCKKYGWEKIFSDYFFNFLMNKGFGVDVDHTEFVPELYKRWEKEIIEIDEKS